MIYEMTPLPDAIRVDGICTVLKADYMKNGGIGESHDFPELIYIARGSVVSIWDGREVEKHAGQLTLIAPGTFHKKKKPSDCEGWIISFTSSSPLLLGLYNQTIDLSEEEQCALGEFFSLGLRCFQRRTSRMGVGGMQLSAEADMYLLESFKKKFELFLLSLHRRYARAEMDEDRRTDGEVQRVCRLLSEHIHENLTVAEIARYAGISVSKLKALFREKGGAVHYFICLKIERSKRMMQEGRMNFSEIADALGFASLHYFSRTFKAVTGVSPSQFRRLV